MTIKDLYGQKKISKEGFYKDGTYFILSAVEKALVGRMTEETYLSTRFLSLSYDGIHSRSKQELKNDVVKGNNKQPRTMAATLHFPHYHDLRNNAPQ